MGRSERKESVVPGGGEGWGDKPADRESAVPASAFRPCPRDTGSEPVKAKPPVGSATQLRAQ